VRNEVKPAVILIAASAAACSALVFGDVERVSSPPADGGGGDDDPDEDEDDATGDGATGPAPAPSCDLAKPFEVPQLAADFDPSARVSRGALESPDRLEAYFISSTGSDFILRRLHRAKVGDKWQPAETVSIRPPPLVGLSLSAGALKLHYQACVPDGSTQLCQNYVNVRPAISAIFAGDSRVFVSGNKVQTDLFVVASDDSAIYTALLPDSGGNASIVQTPVNSSGPIFTLERPVPKVNVAGSDVDKPVLNATETILYFSSNRPGGQPGASYEVWTATRPTKTADFGAPTFVRELSAQGIDSVSWISDDGCEVYVDRSDHVYYAKRPP
jgi:hypothetical protein